jgi:hypothetical protein
MFRFFTTKRYREIQDVLRKAVSAVEFAEKRADDAEKALKEFKSKPTVYCSFCAKSQHEVAKLIVGPTAFICDECVNFCTEIVHDDTRVRADLQLIDDAITSQFGERCDELDTECDTCRAWAYIDKLSGRPVAGDDARVTL